MDDLLTRLNSHIAAMAPHQADRRAGKLLIEAAAEIERLRKSSEEDTAIVADASEEVTR